MEILSANSYKRYKQLDRVRLLRGAYNKKTTGKRICFRTGIYEHDLNNHFLHKTPFKGRGWHADFRTYQYDGSAKDSGYMKAMHGLRKLGYIWNAFTNYYDDIEEGRVNRSQPELIIYADDFTRALSAIRLIPAAISVFKDSFFDVEQETSKYGWNLNERLPYLSHEIPENRYSTDGLAQSIQLLARVSHSNKIRYSMLRYWASKKLCSVDAMITHGKANFGDAGLTKNPIAHTLFSQSIVLAYGAIEELGFKMELITKKGLTETAVLDNAYKNLAIKLEKSGVHPETEILWSTATRSRKIDNKFKVASLKKIEDIGSISTTKTIKLIDAIYFASRLRSHLSAHKFKTDTLKLTAKDVWNTQNIARYLICHQTKILDQMPIYTY